MDGKLPNHRVHAHLCSSTSARQLRRTAPRGWPGAVQSSDLSLDDHVNGSAIFERSRPVADALLIQFPSALAGGTGEFGITTLLQDYLIYPDYPHSVVPKQRIQTGVQVLCRSFQRRCRTAETDYQRGRRGSLWPRNLCSWTTIFLGSPTCGALSARYAMVTVGFASRKASISAPSEKRTASRSRHSTIAKNFSARAGYIWRATIARTTRPTWRRQSTG